ncbi:phosphatidylglycerophosphatase A family protein [Roseomonas marmotae]|uniref:Phosphatidylglycerophosphatase A n=1 Tax=Roseomonas marmotae TaxID=2768161 RepID=A0ABS3KA27_9PROT|nr:phosphatidylglycerophosphatase A [Roseomonas marmotae]MBO1074307.1 phosphatidylglycerophosphatase A [Roseomonas marmotae]QTI78060.1 phosphatidylglycerophosphatase A [Roseomonas marmotae]
MSEQAELPANLPESAPSAISATLPRFVASLGGVGFLRPAPGTWGSLLVLPVALAGPEASLSLALALSILGWWALTRLPEAQRDPGWVVVDEGAGQSLALAALPVATGIAGVLLAFLLFRAFDILKPGPVGWADRRKGPAGVMLDDIIAGALAAALLLAARWMGVTL